MFLLVLAHLGCPGQNPESCKTVVCVYVCVLLLKEVASSVNRIGTVLTLLQPFYREAVLTDNQLPNVNFAIIKHNIKM